MLPTFVAAEAAPAMRTPAKTRLVSAPRAAHDGTLDIDSSPQGRAGRARTACDGDDRGANLRPGAVPSQARGLMGPGWRARPAGGRPRAGGEGRGAPVGGN